MKLARYRYRGHIFFGVLEDGMLHELERTPFLDLKRQGRSYGLEEVELLTPVFPQKIIAVGLNYRDHAEEFGLEMPEEPVLFMKPPSSLLAHGGEIVYPEMSRRVDYEAELALVCGRECRDVSPREAPSCILGYTCGNDVTARDLQAKDGQWTRAKSFDTFCPLGPFIETDLDPSDLRIELRLNGETRQSSTTANMAFGPADLLSFTSRIMTLYPGDVIMTGTPSGVGEMFPGDRVEVVIEGLDPLRNTVVATG
ncbi:MAG: fumarylacetoacetate hydrolase family protein [Actinobacteria bacterium]|nr:fumarylacetoacetate hydrolase family protein [Actinomycetota bacterium]